MTKITVTLFDPKSELIDKKTNNQSTNVLIKLFKSMRWFSFEIPKEKYDDRQTMCDAWGFVLITDVFFVKARKKSGAFCT